MSDTLDALLRAQALRWGAKTAIVDPTERISYQELDAVTLDLATAFVEEGLGKGSRVGLIMPNGVQWARIALALSRIGAVLVPLSTLLTPPELTAQLRMASVQHVIAVEEFRGHRYVDEIATAKLPALRSVRTPAQVSALPAGTAAAAVADALARGVRSADAFASPSPAWGFASPIPAPVSRYPQAPSE